MIVTGGLTKLMSNQRAERTTADVADILRRTFQDVIEFSINFGIRHFKDKDDGLVILIRFKASFKEALANLFNDGFITVNDQDHQQVTTRRAMQRNP